MTRTKQSGVVAHRIILFAGLTLCIQERAIAFQEDSLTVASQNPSPMVEYARAHKRVAQKLYDGISFELTNILAKPVQVFIPGKTTDGKAFDLLVHFHGASHVVQYAATHYSDPAIAVTINLGSGSKIYNDAFEDSTKFSALVDSIETNVRASLKHPIRLRAIILSGFSAGYGAIRKIISTQTNYRTVHAVILLDGLHASYVPERKVLSEGGHIDTSGLLPFITFAQDALHKGSNKKFLITHSEIFPGTFVSTTEATDFMITTLGLKRTPVLLWGPLGMQQISTVKKNHFMILGFAGNTAPDHIDHYHGLFWFLDKLKEL